MKDSQLCWWLCGATKQDRSSLRINFNEYEEARPPQKIVVGKNTVLAPKLSPPAA